MRLVFDLDGTLIDTREANLAAYRSVGVEPPSTFMRYPWWMWMTSKELHARKIEAYPNFLHLTRPLPLALLLIHWRGEILTGASPECAEALLDYHPRIRDAATSVKSGLSLAFKIEELKSGPPGLYFDDDEEACKLIRMTTDWEAVWTPGQS